MINETIGDGVDMGVVSSIKAAALHLEELGAVVTEVPTFGFIYHLFCRNLEDWLGIFLVFF